MSAAVSPGVIIQGEALLGPLRVLLVRPLGSSLDVGGQGLRTNQYHDRLLTPEEAGGLRIIQAEAPFDGDPLRLGVGVEAARLALAYKVVFDSNSRRRPLRIQDPARFGWQPIVTIEHYQLDPQAIESAAE